MHIKELLQEVIEYSKEKYIDYPSILKEYVKRKYGIIL